MRVDVMQQSGKVIQPVVFGRGKGMRWGLWVARAGDKAKLREQEELQGRELADARTMMPQPARAWRSRFGSMFHRHTNSREAHHYRRDI